MIYVLSYLLDRVITRPAEETVAERVEAEMVEAKTGAAAMAASRMAVERAAKSAGRLLTSLDAQPINTRDRARAGDLIPDLNEDTLSRCVLLTFESLQPSEEARPFHYAKDFFWFSKQS